MMSRDKNNVSNIVMSRDKNNHVSIECLEILFYQTRCDTNDVAWFIIYRDPFTSYLKYLAYYSSGLYIGRGKEKTEEKRK
jgi:hypothetical protein